MKVKVIPQIYLALHTSTSNIRLPGRRIFSQAVLSEDDEHKNNPTYMEVWHSNDADGHYSYLLSVEGNEKELTTIREFCKQVTDLSNSRQ